MRIGVYGGTFDPPHAGHLALARAALEQLQLDEVLFLPAFRNPLKERRIATPPHHRLGMVEALIRNEERMAVSDIDITRGGPSYTVDTLTELHMIQPAEYWFLIGADSLKTLPDWKSPRRLLQLCRFGVAVRPPMTDTELAAKIPEQFKEHIDIVKMDPVDVSSTDLRDRLARNQSVSPAVPTDVLKYINTHHLYRA